MAEGQMAGFGCRQTRTLRTVGFRRKCPLIPFYKSYLHKYFVKSFVLFKKIISEETKLFF